MCDLYLPQRTYVTYKSHRIAFETDTIAYNTIADYKILIRHNIAYGMI